MSLDETPMLGWWLKRRQIKRIRADALDLLAETRRILRKFSYRITEEVLREVRSAAEDLTEAISGTDAERIKVDLGRLEESVERHLSFGRKSEGRKWVESVGVAVFIALLLRAFVVEAFKIPSGSMLPTLEIGDHLFVNKFVYGLQVPFMSRKFTHFRQPDRGEVVVFIYPKQKEKDFIKRVVAVEGDVIEVRQNRIILNGVAVPRRSLERPCSVDDRDEYTGTWEQRSCERFEEHLGGFTYETIQAPTASLHEDFGPTQIEPGKIFVMGDNRDNSHDSRYWGQVPLDYVKGKALFLWLSWGRDGMRWKRLFRSVHDDEHGLEAP